MTTDGLYSIQDAARGAGIPVRRLAGWLEQGILVPTVPAEGSGSRRRFSAQDVLRIAVLAETQKLLGTNLRPGALARKLGADTLVLPYLDRASAIGIREADGGQGAGLLLYAYQTDKGQLAIGATREGPAGVSKTTPVALLIDVAGVWRRVRERLGQ